MQHSFVLDAPPPSYDQAIDSSSSSHSPFGHSNPVVAIPNGLELSEKVVAQSELIRAQETEIGKLKRDLGKMREQMERMGKAGGAGGGGGEAADKLARRLAVVVGEEAEEQRRKNRGRKGDILRGSLCCVALLCLVLLGLYIVLSRPNSVKPIKVSLEEFKVLGKTIGDSLCWAQGRILPGKETLGCHIFRRSLEDRRLFCEFHLRKEGQQQKQERPLLRGSWRARRKGLIVMEEGRRQRRDEPKEKADTEEHSAAFLLHVLNETEAVQARKLCTELPLPRLLLGTAGHGMGVGRGWRTWMGWRWRGWH